MANTYTTGTPLNFKQAMTEAVELFNIQSQRDHELIEAAHDAATLQAATDHASIQALIDEANDAISITDVEILEMFSEDVQKKYKKKHTEKWNFTTEPETLLTILNDDTTYTTSFEGYSVALNDDKDTITLSKENATTYTFAISDEGITATGQIGDDTFKVDYKTEAITKLEG